MCLLLLTIGRGSAWLEQAGKSYPEAIPFHRVAGWWCVAQVVIHSAAFVGMFYRDGGWASVRLFCLPLPAKGLLNVYGVTNFLGEVGTAASLVLALTSKEWLRRRRYDLFYAAHVVTSAAFVGLGIFHHPTVLLYSLPGLGAYLLDRLAALPSRSQRRPARLKLLAPGVLRVELDGDALPGSAGLEPGTRWAYVKIPEVSGHEWHPYSVVWLAGAPTLHIKGEARWSRRLLAVSERQETADILVDGPFGLPRTPRPLSTLNSSTAGSPSLLLVAGGIGITPWADLLASGDDILAQWEGRVSVVWTVRRHDEYAALAHSLQADAWAEAGATVRVFVTQPGPAAPEVHRSCAESCGPERPRADSAPRRWRSRGVMALATVCSYASAVYVPSLVSGMYAPSAVVLGELCADWPVDAGVLRYGVVCRGGAYALALAAAAGACVLVALLSRAVPCKTWTLGASAVGGWLREPLRCAEAGPTEPGPAGGHALMTGRADLRSEISRAAGDALLVRACGPKPLLAAVRDAVDAARAEGRRVELAVEESEW